MRSSRRTGRAPGRQALAVLLSGFSPCVSGKVQPAIPSPQLNPMQSPWPLPQSSLGPGAGTRCGTRGRKAPVVTAQVAETQAAPGSVCQTPQASTPLGRSLQPGPAGGRGPLPAGQPGRQPRQGRCGRGPAAEEGPALLTGPPAGAPSSRPERGGKGSAEHFRATGRRHSREELPVCGEEGE